MTRLKSYTCAKCGAVLSVDKLQGQMACPFCGNGFDYIDFHRDELISQGEDCLARGAFDPAKEKFNKILENDPKDIRAIRGLVLATARIHSTGDMQYRYDQVCSALDEIKEIVFSAQEIVTEEERCYLDNLVCLFEFPIEYNKIQHSKDEAMGLEKKRDVQLEVKDYRDGILARIIGYLVWPLMFLLFLSSWFLFEDTEHRAYFFFIILPLMIAIIAGYIFLFKKLRVKPVKILESSNSLSDRLEDYEKKYSEILSEVLEFEATFMEKPEEKEIRKEEKPEPKSKPVPEAATDTKTLRQIICAKCGGLLKLNNAQELYECNSCGVSYGKALFFGDLTANAVRAMNMGEFAEADQILSHKLMANPKDFESLFGRFLCAGKWKSLADIDLNDRLLRFHLKNLPGQLDMIEKRISIEDQPLWENIRKLSDLLSEYAVRMAAFNRVREKYVSICGKLNDDLMSKEIEDYTRQKDEIYEKLTVLDGECTEISDRINEAIKSLTDADSGCVFFNME